MTTQSPFTDVPTAIEEIRAGRMIVVVDDEDRVPGVGDRRVEGVEEADLVGHLSED